MLSRMPAFYKTYNLGHNFFWQFTAFQYRFDSPQVKRDFISCILPFVRELFQVLTKDLKIRILKTFEKNVETGWKNRLVSPKEMNFCQ